MPLGNVTGRFYCSGSFFGLGQNYYRPYYWSCNRFSTLLILAEIGNLRELNIENVEKIYAPLIEEFQVLIGSFLWVNMALSR